MAVAGIALLVLSCGDGAIEPPPSPPTPIATTVTVNPASASFTALGETARFTAEVRDQNGQVMAGAAVAWGSSDASVAAVDGSGLVTAAGNGSAWITATAGSVSGTAAVTVAQVVGAVAVSPPADTLVAFGDTVRLVAEATDANGHTVQAVTEFSWSSSDTLVAKVDHSGLVTGVAEGMATITAAVGEVSGNAEITTVKNPDLTALVALYEATDGPNWVDNTNWLTDAPLDEWYGVDTNDSGRVVRINLAGRWDSEARQRVKHGLRGELPNELADLTELTSLFLSTNELEGPIPPELGNLTELTVLDLALNNLTGAIPPELGNLASLRTLALNGTRLTGPIPPEMGNLAQLRGLFLSSNRLTGLTPPELGSLAELTRLDLGYNDLTGTIPPELSNLTELTVLHIGNNNLTGPIPRSFLQLGQLREFRVGGQGVCVPGTAVFVAWLAGIEAPDTEAGVLCNAGDVVALESLYELTDGATWNQSDGWLSDDLLEEWHGITVDSLGHVTEIDLEGNGLTGRLSAALGNLPRLTVLRISDNALSGRLPLGLTGLPLVEFRYSETDLCTPGDASFQGWLNAIATVEGTGVNCAPLSDREILEILYDATDGPNWRNNDNWLTDAPLREWLGVYVDGEGRVSGLVVSFNNLTGAIPPELGGLAKLRQLALDANNLTGLIPAELGTHVPV